jgi:hypothetical protein
MENCEARVNTKRDSLDSEHDPDRIAHIALLGMTT